MLEKLLIILGIDGATTSPIIGNLIESSLACKNIFIDTLVIQVTRDSLLMHQLHYLIKRIDQTLKNRKSTAL